MVHAVHVEVPITNVVPANPQKAKVQHLRVNNLLYLVQQSPHTGVLLCTVRVKYP